MAMVAPSTEPHVRLELRPYQVEALERTATAERRGVRRQLGVAATGLGKTVMFCALAEARGGRALILAHRDELVNQAAAKVREVWPGVDVGVVKAGDNDVHAHVVVASVQTLARERRLAQLIDAYEGDHLLRPVAPFDLVVVDEAHHAAADSYRRILDGLRAGMPEVEDAEFGETIPAGPLLLGVTATPDRGDGKGLDDLFDEITWTYDILWGIRSGYLADVRALAVRLDGLDLGDVKVSRGDYEAGAAGRAMADAQAPEFIVEAWKRHAADRRTLVFTPTVELAQQCADEFRRRGVAAAMVHGGTPLDERRATLAAYKAGTVQVLANCAVLTEGFDEPRTDCVVVARPTKSRALFTQMVGRGTRKHPDKADLLVLDVVGGSDEHSLVTIPSLFGLEQDFAAKLRNAEGLLTDVIDAQEHHLVRVGRMRAEDADLFRQVRSDGIAWVALHEPGQPERYQRSLARRGKGGQYVKLPTVVLTHKNDGDNGWLCGLVMPDGAKRVLIADVPLEMAQGVGEDYARKALGPHGTALIDTSAAWRKKPPSDRAVAAARKWRMPNVDQYKTAGDLSDALDAHIARKTRKD